MIFVIAIALLIALSLYERVSRRLKRSAKCEHGVSGGRYNDLCKYCAARRFEQLRLSEISRAAQNLRNSELTRMKAVRLQKSEYLLSLTSAEFEDAIAGLYRCQGHSVRQTPYTSDGGFDIVATNEKENLYIECKRFSPTSKI